jgi:hypothetical protein
MTRTRLLAAAVVVVTFCVAVGSAGGRTTDTGASVVLSGLIGTDDPTQVQQVTYGGKMGFHLDVGNTGTSTFNHLVIAVDSGAGTSFLDSSRPDVCAKDPTDDTRMVCKLAQMQGGAPHFMVDLRFTAPASGSSVLTESSLTVDAKTQGSPGNKGTQTTTGTSVTTSLESSQGNAVVKTFARGKETIATSATLLQHSQFTMPNTLGSVFGVDTSVEEQAITDPNLLLCADCPAWVTILQIPASTGSGSPFSVQNPFTFTITLLPDGVPRNYSPTGLYHADALVPMCSDSPLDVDTTMCLDSLQTKNYKQKGIVAVGRAYQNGRLGFG